MQDIEKERLIQLKLGKPVVKKIEQIKRNNPDVKTTAEVFRRALTYYSMLEDLKSTKDNSITIVDDEGKKTKLIVC
jgi:hypothetical protein